jgi:hypothetical protein
MSHTHAFFFDGQTIANDSICLLGLPSIGNVGQMACDVLLASLFAGGEVYGLKRIGTIESPYVIPMSGCDAFFMPANGDKEQGNASFICLPLEIYCFSYSNQNYTIIMQRSSCLIGAQRIFYQELCALVNEWKCSLHLIITGASIDNMLRPDGDRELYIPCGKNDGVEKAYGLMPALCNQMDQWDTLSPTIITTENSGGIPTDIKGYTLEAPEGMHSASLCYSMLEGDTMICARYVNEGDNRVDADRLAGVLLGSFGVERAVPESFNKLGGSDISRDQIDQRFPNII